MKTKINTSKDIGSVIRGARLHKKMTIMYVAGKSGFSSATIINIEQNVGSTRTETLIAIASVVGVTIELISDYKEPKGVTK